MSLNFIGKNILRVSFFVTSLFSVSWKMFGDPSGRQGVEAATSTVDDGITSSEQGLLEALLRMQKESSRFRIKFAREHPYWWAAGEGVAKGAAVPVAGAALMSFVPDDYKEVGSAGVFIAGAVAGAYFLSRSVYCIAHEKRTCIMRNICALYTLTLCMLDKYDLPERDGVGAA